MRQIYVKLEMKHEDKRMREEQQKMGKLDTGKSWVILDLNIIRKGMEELCYIIEVVTENQGEVKLRKFKKRENHDEKNSVKYSKFTLLFVNFKLGQV